MRCSRLERPDISTPWWDRVVVLTLYSHETGRHSSTFSKPVPNLRLAGQSAGQLCVLAIDSCDILQFRDHSLEKHRVIGTAHILGCVLDGPMGSMLSGFM